MSHRLLADSVDTSSASLDYIVVQEMRCSVECTISERADKDSWQAAITMSAPFRYTVVHISRTSASATNWTMRVCDLVSPTRSICDLGVYIDADLSMHPHIATTVIACFAALRQIRSMWHSLWRHALLSLVHALVVSKVNYCSWVLAGRSGNLICRLQSVFSVVNAVHISYSLRRDPTTSCRYSVNYIGWKFQTGSSFH